MVTPPTSIYTLSLHDALPIFEELRLVGQLVNAAADQCGVAAAPLQHVVDDAGLGIEVDTEQFVDARHELHGIDLRSEEHTSELQSHHDVVCRLLLSKTTTNPH